MRMRMMKIPFMLTVAARRQWPRWQTRMTAKLNSERGSAVVRHVLARAAQELQNQMRQNS